ncbi:ADP-ribosylglycohydrolase family protein [Solicola sp. PLA-1-18]|uniref:ADP-ribosylglycohydrolase family protein n=1 Tax=Solicola sp. PLA-1-18 TaxID=3380532 RepID=UPI003B829BE0
MSATDPRLDNALGAWWGLAVGDALGMPTQSMSRSAVAEDHGVVDRLLAPGPHQQIARGLPAGSVTDDTEQALLLARVLLDGDGRVDPRALADALVAWERDVAARGSLDLLGPSTKRAVEAVLAGVDPSEAGRHGATNGAAMRVLPVGVAVPVEPLDAFVDAVAESCQVSHATTIGVASAAAVGAAVSAGVDGASLGEAVGLAIAAAEAGAGRGAWVAGADVASRLAWAVPHLRRLPVADVPDAVERLVGTSLAAQESVVAAIALVATYAEPWTAMTTAASLGGDTDTIAAIAGAVGGAVHGLACLPDDVVRTVADVNDLDLEPVAVELLRLRDR